MAFDQLFALEQDLAEYTGAPCVVVTDGCTHALELCLRYLGVRQVRFTAFTYISVIQTVRLLGIEYQLTDEAWQGEYQLQGSPIWDSARRLEPGMYRTGAMQCLSFGHSKPLEVGRCGAILLDDRQAHASLSRMRSDGRDLRMTPWELQQGWQQGWHYCPTLEAAARARELLPQVVPQCQTWTYPDCRQIAWRD